MQLLPAGADSNPDGTDDNYGPHCRNCHSGASSCNQCHKSGGAYDPNADVFGKSPLDGVSIKHARTTAQYGLTAQCVDGGFTWPHRTLGENLLKDEIYGVTWDGSEVDPGGSRAFGGTFDEAWFASAWSDAGIPSTFGSALASQDVENLDSVCIDCHGDATYWDPNALATDAYQTDADNNPSAGNWELLLKGLP